MGRSRKRSGSGSSYQEMLKKNPSAQQQSPHEKHAIAKKDKQHTATRANKVRQCMKALLGWRQDMGKSTVLHERDNFALLSAYLTRAQQLDQHPTTRNATLLQSQLLLERDEESRYTALHWAIYRGDISTVLLLLRHASSQPVEGEDPATKRLTQKPMVLLEFDSSNPTELWQTMVTARDAQGYTPAQLLASLQRSELRSCRASLPQPRITYQPPASQHGRQRRSSTFDLTEPPEEDDELSLLNRNVHLLRPREPSDDSNETGSSRSSAQSEHPKMEYGCEVLTFGRAHPCALGVGTESTTGPATTSGLPASKQTAFRPQRVQAFAQSQVGRSHGAVAISAATHHTMVLNRAGQVYTFGLGKGGRLGIGTERHAPLPMLVSLNKRVVGISCAENHSLAVTACGQLYAWGSNRFGQLGLPTTAASNARSHVLNDGPQGCALTPRRVDDLKDVKIRAAAAGERHSVALTRGGRIYVFGDNSSGQLGLPPRKQHNSRVQLLQPLAEKTTVAVSASDFSTLILTMPPQDGSALPVNCVYSWGHGNHVPSRVHLQGKGRQRTNSSSELTRQSHQNRLASPVAIAAAKYHNVVVMDNGSVYSWGYHKESLGGGSSQKNRATDFLATTPQLVEGMLPENGGGLAVAVDASENHTAVLTDCGSLYTWGATYGPNVLGHEGVRFQPDPKKVPGVCRGVAVAAAPQHIVVLAGASFPPKPVLKPGSLEELAAARITTHIDLFNVLPILITAERANNETLIDYCRDFCKRNLDAVLNVSQRSVMECYLTEQLQTHVLGTRMDPYERQEARDANWHPILKDFVLGKNQVSPFYPTDLSPLGDWLVDSCELTESLPGRILLKKLQTLQLAEATARSAVASPNSAFARKARSVSFGQDQVVTVSKCSLRCLELSRVGDLKDAELEDRQVQLSKEIRAVRKRLNQISKLEVDTNSLCQEQRDKVARKSQLEADLARLEPALSNVEKRISSSSQEEKPAKEEVPEGEGPPELASEEPAEKSRTPFRCDLCSVTCPDESSFFSHQNGRKHRNRIAQVEQEEQNLKALLVEKEHQKESMKKSMQTAKKSSKPPNPWATGKDPTSPSPGYKLPPPPHEVPSALSSSSTATKGASLLDIMADESRKTPVKSKAIRVPSQKGNKTPSPSLLQKKIASPSVKNPTPKQNGSPWQLNVGSLPTLESPPWSTNPVARVSVHQQPGTKANYSQPGTVAPSSKSAEVSLGDYIEKPKIATSPNLLASSPARKTSAWGVGSKQTKPEETGGTPSKTSAAGFAKIQDEEMEFKAKEDRACSVAGGDKGKWFVERRERANSLMEIQKSCEKEREERLFIEEQHKIEQQIYAELQEEQKKKEASRQQQQSNNRRRRRPKKSAPKEGGSNKSKNKKPQPKEGN